MNVQPLLSVSRSGPLFQGVMIVWFMYDAEVVGRPIGK